MFFAYIKAFKNYKIYLIDENNLMVETNYSPKEFLLGENQTVLIKNS